MERKRLDLTTWPDLVERPPVVVVPVGSCEQHGPHLPLGTDTIIAGALAERAVARLDDAVLAPPLTITASGEHQAFPGTLSLGTAVVTEMLVELARSADWSAGIVLVNGHGGNHDAVSAAVARTAAEGRRMIAWWPRVPTEPDDQLDLHAGRTETSLLLAIDPALVDLAAAEEVRAVALDAAGMTRLRAEGVHAVSDSGVLGDPSGATTEHGRRLLDALTDDLVATVETAITGWR